MRSQLVFDAITHTSNRYRLTMLAARATRKLHRPGTPIPNTVNEALARLGDARPPAEMGSRDKALTTPQQQLPSSRKDLEPAMDWIPHWDNPAAVAENA